VVSALMGALRDKNSSVRERAAEALERLGYPSPAVISALRDRLDDRGTVSDAAFAALWQLAPKMYEERAAMVSTDEKRING
jgi:HEAT repeat protein